MTTLTGVVSFPIPAYSNVPINAQYYEPSLFFISAISNGITTLVTTTQNHNYVVGQLVRLVIPRQNRSIQFNGQSGYVVGIPASNQVTLDINSSTYDTFQTTTQANQPQILAIGDVNQGSINSSGNLNTATGIPGAFINISPL